MKIYHEVAGNLVETEIPVIESKEDLFYLKLRSFMMQSETESFSCAFQSDYY